MLLDFGFSISFGQIVLAQIAALALDHWLGEPTRFHPLVGFGRYAAKIEQQLNQPSVLPRKLAGILAWLMAVLPLVILLSLLIWVAVSTSSWLFWLLNVLVLYFTLGLKSLAQHADYVAEPLAHQDLDEARHKVSWLVSRNTQQMDETQINKACIESVLENGSDAVYGALFWFAVAGAPGALLYRLSNTLDASWGYRTERFVDFGYCAARMDDVLNLIPARICSLAYSLSGNCCNAFAAWARINHWRKTEGQGFASPNAGIVMSSGAGALNLSLGGVAFYQGAKVIKPVLGIGQEPGNGDIGRSVDLLRRSLMLTLAIQLLVAAILLGFSAQA